MISVASAEVLQAVAAEHPVRALQVGTTYLTHEALGLQLLRSCTGSSWLGEVHTLAIGASWPVLEAVACMHEAGQLPKLKKLLLQSVRHDVDVVLEWFGPSAAWLVQAGSVVQLLYTTRVERCQCCSVQGAAAGHAGP